MSSASPSSATASVYAISDATKQLMPNDSVLQGHLYRHVANEFFCSPEQTNSRASAPSVYACGLRSKSWPSYYDFVKSLQSAHQSTGVRLKTLYFLRHAQGTHNVAEAKFGTKVWDESESLKEEYTDPDITAKGVGQCDTFAEALPPALEAGLKADLVITSPLKRTLRTAELCLGPLYGKVPIVSVEHARETLGEHTCDRRSAISKMKAQFGGVQFHLIEHDEDPLWTTKRETDEEELIRAQRYLEFLFSLPEENIVLVGHSGILTALSKLFWKSFDPKETVPMQQSNEDLLAYLRRDGALGCGMMDSRHCELQPFCVAQLPLPGSISAAAAASAGLSQAATSSILAAPSSSSPSSATTKTLGFITSIDDPNLTADDRVLLPPLEKEGIRVLPIAYDSDKPLAPLLSQCDGLVFRSCWTYHRKHAQFAKFLQDLESFQGKIGNPLKANLWNLNKKYLIEMHRAGCPGIPKTILLPAQSPIADLQEAVASFLPHTHVVLKPSVSMSGEDTYLVSTAGDMVGRAVIGAHGQDIMHAQNRDLLVQEFLPEIASAGETSYHFFRGAFSHAIKKTPSRGEFRVQITYGGVQVECHPSETRIAQAKNFLKYLPEGEQLLSVRIDVVERDEEMMLVEAEIIDPSLYFQLAPAAVPKFVQAVVEYFE